VVIKRALKTARGNADTYSGNAALNQTVQQETASDRAATQAGVRLLVVDDNRAIHGDFRKVLAPAGEETSRLTNAAAALFGDESDPADARRPRFIIDSAYQGEEALDRVKDSVASGNPYSVAFIDVRMPPGWDGIETTAHIWKVDPDLQVVICTAFSDYSWDEMLTKLGHSDRVVILKKPFDGIEVLQLASSLSTKRSLQAESRNRVAVLEEMVQARAAELVREHQKLSEFFNNSPAGIFQTTRDGCYVSANPALARILGFQSPEELTREVSDIASQVYVDPAMRGEFVRRLETEGFVRDLELEVRCKDGSRKWVSVTATRPRDTEHSGHFIHGFLVDISEQKRALYERNLLEAQLRSAQKLESVGQLAAGIAHEINTPIQYVGDNIRFISESFAGLSQLVSEQQKLCAAAKAGETTPAIIAAVEAAAAAADLEYLAAEIPKALQQTQEGVKRVSAIVNAMKEFSHPGTAEKTPVNLNRAIETTVTVARNEWKYVSEVATDFDADLPLVPCFPGEFNQVILNLVVNAAHAIGDALRRNPGPKGVITIKTRRNGSWAEVSVADTGTGIPESVRHRIFEPFFTTKEVGKGTGQGLAIARATIVKKLGGELTFETFEGRGTTFLVRLPLQPPPAATGANP
jgi:two-component system NtrC family sensor kinase